MTRRCFRCGTRRQFLPTEKFRVNANGGRIDVWLLFRCGHCNTTVKAEIVSRQHVALFAPGQLERFMSNDPSLARRYTSDPGFLGRNAFELEGSTTYAIDGDVLETIPESGETTISIVLARGVKRLDKILAQQLRVSRAVSKRLLASGAVSELTQRTNSQGDASELVVKIDWSGVREQRHGPASPATAADEY